MNTINIAIDGPAGAGKSTLAKIFAKELSIDYISSLHIDISTNGITSNGWYNLGGFWSNPYLYISTVD